MGTGVAWIDYDQDGLMDLYFVQSAATDIYKPPHLALRALSQQRRRDIHRRDSEGGSWRRRSLWTRGRRRRLRQRWLARLYVTGYGRAILYRNNHDGTFTDVTAKAGVADEGDWSTSAGWFDYDKDGWLDLVVTNYIDWSPKNNLWCGERAPGIAPTAIRVTTRPEDKALPQQP